MMAPPKVPPKVPCQPGRRIWSAPDLLTGFAMLGLAGLGLLLWGLYTGLGSGPFGYCALGLLLLYADGQNRRR